MKFDWTEFYDVGIHLRQYSKKEAYQRPAIGRVYYACFNNSREYYENNYHPLSSFNTHNTLINKLEKSVNSQEIKLSSLLRQLRKLRTFADYEQNFKEQNVSKSIDLANEILDLLKQLDT